MYKGSAARGTNIQIYRENHSNAQKWVLNPITVNKQKQTITASSVTKTVGNAAFNLNAKTSGNGKLTYKSNNAKVAKISGTGQVTVVGPGIATITITAAETAAFKAATKQVSVSVRPKPVTVKSLQNSKAGILTVSWYKGTDVTGYRIQLADNASFTNAKTVSVSGGNIISKDISVVKGKTYWVRIQAYTGIVYSTWSTAKQTTITK